jgi:hypothetical protein
MMIGMDALNLQMRNEAELKETEMLGKPVKK